MKKLSCISFILVLFMVGCEDAAEPEIKIEDDSISTDIDTTFSEIISDPAGDMVVGGAPDAISVQAKRTSTHILFRVFFAEDVDMDSVAVILSLDTDQDPNTGGTSLYTGQFPGVWDVGPNYDALAVLPRFRPPGVQVTIPALSLVIFNNFMQEISEPIADAVSADSNMIEFAVPLSELGNDDGNMDVAGYSAHQSFAGEGQTLDYIPNTGHGTVGD